MIHRAARAKVERASLVRATALLLATCGLLAACSGEKSDGTAQAVQPTAPSAPTASAGPAGQSSAVPSDALPADKTGGFDGARAFAHVANLVAFGPRRPNSPGIHQAQEYIRTQLKSFGCAVDEDEFTASTPVGRVPMRNIIAKIPGKTKSILLLLTHYDTFPLEHFVGANDSGSSTGLMLEMARLLCRRQNALTVRVAFLDGEEAFVKWTDTDSTYGSRQLAAQMALSGDLKRVKAVILADMIGDRNLNILREQNSTRWLRELVVGTATRLGYEKEFSGGESAIEDDHEPFLKRGVAAVDLIDFDYPPWHTADDTLDKVSARSLGIVGHVILEVIPALEKKFPN